MIIERLPEHHLVLGYRMATGSLRVNRDIIMATKRHSMRERQQTSPREAVLALAEMANNPPHILNTIQDYHGRHQKKITVIGQINRTQIYDPVATALHMRSAGVDAVSFFTDHAIYKNDFEDLLLVTRAMRQLPIIFQNYVFDEYGIMAVRSAGAAGIMLYGSLLEPEEMRQLTSLAQRWRMTVFCQVDSPDYLEYVTHLSPHVIVYGDPIEGDFDRDLAQFSAYREHIPAYTQFIFAHPLKTIHEVKAVVAQNVRGLIVAHEMFNDARQQSELIQLVR